MDQYKSIINYTTVQYGEIHVKLAELMKSRKISRNRLHTLTGIKYDVIDRYYKADHVEMVDLDFLAKVCFVLNCRIEDLLEYNAPNE